LCGSSACFDPHLKVNGELQSDLFGPIDAANWAWPGWKLTNGDSPCNEIPTSIIFFRERMIVISK
jgi:hypothetical protein